MRIGWRTRGDRDKREFFKATKAIPTKNSITTLEDSSLGTVDNSQDVLEAICLEFYTQLYKDRVSQVEHETTREHVVIGVHSKLSRDV